MEPIPMYRDAKSKTAFEDGLEFQDFCRKELLNFGVLAVYNTSKKQQFEEGESVHGIEIKLDNLCTKTGRLSIEVYEKPFESFPAWIASGILREDNTWLYVQGNRTKVFAMPKMFLRSLYEKRYKDQVITSRGTVRKFYIPLDEAEKYSVFVFPRAPVVQMAPKIIVPDWVNLGCDAFLGLDQQEAA